MSIVKALRVSGVFVTLMVLTFLGTFTGSAQIANFGTVNAYYNFTNLVSLPANVASVTITPIAPGAAWGSALISPYIQPWTRANTSTLTNGNLTVSNLACNYGFQVDIACPPGTDTIFTNFFPANYSNQTVNAANFVCVNIQPGQNPFQPAFLNAIVTNIYQINYASTNVLFASGTNTVYRTSGVTNIFDVAPNSFDPFGQAVQSTNDLNTTLRAVIAGTNASLTANIFSASNVLATAALSGSTQATNDLNNTLRAVIIATNNILVTGIQQSTNAIYALVTSEIVATNAATQAQIQTATNNAVISAVSVAQTATTQATNDLNNTLRAVIVVTNTLVQATIQTTSNNLVAVIIVTNAILVPEIYAASNSAVAAAVATSQAATTQSTNDLNNTLRAVIIATNTATQTQIQTATNNAVTSAVTTAQMATTQATNDLNNTLRAVIVATNTATMTTVQVASNALVAVVIATNAIIVPEIYAASNSAVASAVTTAQTATTQATNDLNNTLRAVIMATNSATQTQIVTATNNAVISAVSVAQTATTAATNDLNNTLRSVIIATNTATMTTVQVASNAVVAVVIATNNILVPEIYAASNSAVASAISTAQTATTQATNDLNNTLRAVIVATNTATQTQIQTATNNAVISAVATAQTATTQATNDLNNTLRAVIVATNTATMATVQTASNTVVLAVIATNNILVPEIYAASNSAVASAVATAQTATTQATNDLNNTLRAVIVATNNATQTQIGTATNNAVISAVAVTQAAIVQSTNDLNTTLRNVIVATNTAIQVQIQTATNNAVISAAAVAQLATAQATNDLSRVLTLALQATNNQLVTDLLITSNGVITNAVVVISNLVVNLSAAATNGGNLVFTNSSEFVQTFNGSATNLSVQGQTVFGSDTNFFVDTNLIGLFSSGIAQANGTYKQWQPATSPGNWTNWNYPTWNVIQSGSVFNLISNGTTWYTISGSVAGRWSPVGPAPGPGPIGFVGLDYRMNGVWLSGWLASSNLTYQITNGIVGGVLSGTVGNSILSTAGTNVVLALIAQFAENPTNGISAATATNIAAAMTNGLNLASGLSAFTPTNQFIASQSGNGTNVSLWGNPSLIVQSNSWFNSSNALVTIQFGTISNVIPLMTSSNFPSGFATANSFVTGFEPYRAFSQSTAPWKSSTGAANLTNYLEYVFPAQQVVTAYSLWADGLGAAGSSSYENFTLQGSGDGVNWTNLANNWYNMKFLIGSSTNITASFPAFVGTYFKWQFVLTNAYGANWEEIITNVSLASFVPYNVLSNSVGLDLIGSAGIGINTQPNGNSIEAAGNVDSEVGFSINGIPINAQQQVDPNSSGLGYLYSTNLTATGGVGFSTNYDGNYVFTPVGPNNWPGGYWTNTGNLNPLSAGYVITLPSLQGGVTNVNTTAQGLYYQAFSHMVTNISVYTNAALGFPTDGTACAKQNGYLGTFTIEPWSAVRTTQTNFQGPTVSYGISVLTNIIGSTPVNAVFATNGAAGGNLPQTSFNPILASNSLSLNNYIVLIGYGTSADIGVFTTNSATQWVNCDGVQVSGGWTNANGKNIIVFDPTYLDNQGFAINPFQEGPTNMNLQVGPNFDIQGLWSTPNQFLQPDIVAWNVDNGSGTFTVTNGINASAVTNKANLMQFGTNNWDFWGAIKALPYGGQGAASAPLGNGGQGLRSGGTVIVPPGVTFIGTNSFLSSQPFALEIDGSEGGHSVLIITNGDGTQPGIHLGTACFGPNHSAGQGTSVSVTIRNLKVGYQNDTTNAAIFIDQPNQAIIENLTVFPASVYFNSDQYIAPGVAATNEIGLKIGYVDGQMVSIYNLKTVANHIGVWMECDHPAIYGWDSEGDGKGGIQFATNWWGTNVESLACGLLYKGGFSLPIYDIHAFQTKCLIFNASTPNAGFPGNDITIYGGDYSEGGGVLSATTSSNNSPVVSYSATQSGFVQANVLAVGTTTNWHTTSVNAPNSIQYAYTNNVNGFTAQSLLVGGVPQVYFTPNGTIFPGGQSIAGNGSGLTNIPAAALQFSIIQTNFISGKLYVNSYGAPLGVSANPVLTLTGVAGASNLGIWVVASPAVGGITNNSSMTTLITSLATTVTNGPVSFYVPTNAIFGFTNLSTGAGDSATVSGGQILVY